MVWYESVKTAYLEYESTWCLVQIKKTKIKWYNKTGLLYKNKQNMFYVICEQNVVHCVIPGEMCDSYQFYRIPSFW